MKSIKYILIIISISLIAINCTGKTEDSVLNKFSYTSIGSPSEDWVGKHLKIKFANIGGKSIRGKTKIVELIDYDKDDEGYKYFTVKDLSDGYLETMYLFWFNNTDFGPSIISWEEATPK